MQQLIVAVVVLSSVVALAAEPLQISPEISSEQRVIEISFMSDFDAIPVPS